MSNSSDQGDPTPDLTQEEPPVTTAPEQTAQQTENPPTTEEPPTTEDPPPPETTQEPPPPDTTQEPPPETTQEPPQTTEEPPPPQTTEQPPPQTTQNEPDNTTQPEPDPDPEPTQSADTSVTTVVTDSEGQTSTVVVVQTRTASGFQTSTLTTPTPTSTTAAGSSGGNSGLNTGGKIAVAVVVPIAAVALLVALGLFFWRKRRARKDAEEQRKQDLKDYAYNPNDPTVPPLTDAQHGYEMKEDAGTAGTVSSGYRGWGTTTLTGSMGHKTSTTMSGGGVASAAASAAVGGGNGSANGAPYSDMTNLLNTTAASDTTRSGDTSIINTGNLPVRSDGTTSPESGEILAPMNGPPSASHMTRTGIPPQAAGVRRGPSNASSSYSAGRHSDDSESGMPPIGVAYGSGLPPQAMQQGQQGGGGGQLAYGGYAQYGGGNPYADNPYAFAPGPPGQPAAAQRGQEQGQQGQISGMEETGVDGAVIRDNSSRRTTRIENPSPYAQQPGISQNF